MKRKTWLTLLGALAYACLLVYLLLMPLQAQTRGLRAFYDLLHAPCFAILALAGCLAVEQRFSQHRGRVTLGVWLAIISLGLTIEWFQDSIGRSASWVDAVSNVLGASAGCLAYLSHGSRNPRTRFGLPLLAITLLFAAVAEPLQVLSDVAVQMAEMPLLASFEYDGELSRWLVRESRCRRVPQHATAGQWALQVQLKPGKYPGVIFQHPPRDWSGYSALAMDITLAGPGPLRLVIKVQDIGHDGETDDRFHRRVLLKPGRQTIRIPLDEIRQAPHTRQLDVSQIRLLQLMTIRPQTPRSYFLDNMRLE